MSTNKNSAGNAPFPLAQLAASNEDLRKIQAQLAEGAVTPDAPCNAMYDDWTPEEEAKLDSALDEVFGFPRT